MNIVELPPEIHTMIFAHCDYVTENRLQQVCRLFTAELPGIKMPPVFRELYESEEKSENLLLLLECLLRQGPSWILRVSVEQLRYDNPFALKIHSLGLQHRQSGNISGPFVIILEMTSDMRGLPVFRMTLNNRNQAMIMREEDDKLALPLRHLEWNIKWSFSLDAYYTFRAWSWEGIEAQCEVLPWKDIAKDYEIVFCPPRQNIRVRVMVGLDRIQGIQAEAIEDRIQVLGVVNFDE